MPDPTEAPVCERTPAWAIMYSWVIVTCVLVVAWDMTLGRVFQTLHSAMQAARVNARPITRPHLMALVLYAIITAWFRALFFMGIIYTGVTFLILTVHNLSITFYVRFIMLMLSPSHVFAAMQPETFAFHATVALIMLGVAIVAILGYIRNKDLDGQFRDVRVHAKFARIMMACIGLMIVGYGIHALYETLLASLVAKP